MRAFLEANSGIILAVTIVVCGIVLIIDQIWVLIEMHKIWRK